MGFVDTIRSWTDILLEREEEDFDSDIPESVLEAPNPSLSTAQVRAPRGGNEATRSKVVDMQVQTSVKVSWHRPRTYNDSGEARQIADDLNNNRSVILNLEDIEKKDARRLLDFLSGVAYARSSVIKKIATNVYLFGPHNLDFVGDDLMTMLGENNYL